MKNLQEYIENPKPIAKTDKIVQLLVNERYDVIALFESGRVFKKRAKGSSGSYDLWQEIDMVREIKEDLKL